MSRQEEEAKSKAGADGLDVGSLEVDSYRTTQQQVLEEVIENQFLKVGAEYNMNEVREIAALSLSICPIDVMEVFSSSRFTSLAACYGYAGVWQLISAKRSQTAVICEI